MSHQHQELATGRWRTLNLASQLANVGSEVERAVRWQSKGHEDYAGQARERALELLLLTINDPKHCGRLKEITRLYEVLVDYLAGENIYRTDRKALERYFLQFTQAARKPVRHSLGDGGRRIAASIPKTVSGTPRTLLVTPKLERRVNNF